MARKSKKRILITGVTGFVGSHLADFLSEHSDHQLFGLKRVNSSLRNIHHLVKRNKITLLDGDLLDENSLRNVLKVSKPDYVYHLGALSWVTPSWYMASVYMQTNAIGTIHLFEALRTLRLAPRILVSCTPEEFGDVPEKEIPLTEESKVAPVNMYAASKVAQDMVCQSYFASYHLPIVRTRAFNHEGPRRDIHGALSSFAFQIARIERGLQKPVVQVGTLSARRNFTDVRDMVKAYVLAIEKGKAGELYLIGSNQIYTIEECLQLLIQLSSTKQKITIKTEKSRVRPTELTILVGKFDKFEKLTGWKPEIAFEKTLGDMLSYWRNIIDKNLY